MSYEFSDEQNELFRGLAHKMGLVGLLAVVVGVVNLISALLLLVFVFQDQLPSEAMEQIPAEVRSELPPTNALWGLVIQVLVVGIFYLLIGTWTRSAAGSFREIVSTTGRDISHLMTALGALHKLYTLLYTLIIVTLVFVVVGVLLQLFLRSAG